MSADLADAGDSGEVVGSSCTGVDVLPLAGGVMVIVVDSELPA